MKILIDPRTRIVYASYYMIGLWEKFGRQNVKFSMQPFTSLRQKDVQKSFDQYFAFIVEENGHVLKRIIIDYRDKSNIVKNPLEWADVYAKVNFDSTNPDYTSLESTLQDKILPIGPNFGVRIWNWTETGKYLTINYLKSKKYLPVNLRTFISGYWWQLKRECIDFYQPEQSKTDYIFHASNLYKNRQDAETINNLRAMFIRSCKNNKNCLFEGGLFTKSDQTFDQFQDVLTKQYFKADEYLENIRNSTFVFNTPAAWECHGWKLGEYLAMGKAIISTPLVNEMPEKMVHGENILFVETKKEMEDVVNQLLEDEKLRNKLEDGAQEYYKKWLKPGVVTNRIIEKGSLT